MRGTVSLLLLALAAGDARAGATQVGCGPTRGTCGPTTVVAPVAPTALPAPDWTSAFLAVWALDEASGTRVNRQGTASRNLTPQGGTPGNDPTTKMEGLAALVNGGLSTYLESLDATLAALAAPFTCLAWVRFSGTGGAPQSIVETGDGTTGFRLLRDVATGRYGVLLAGDALWSVATDPLQVWTHLAAAHAAGTTALFRNGTVDGTTANTYTVGTVFHVGHPDTESFLGHIDELACIATALLPASVCRICSCLIAGTLCTCDGAAYTTRGRNATGCGSCDLPANCAASAPS